MFRKKIETVGSISDFMNNKKTDETKTQFNKRVIDILPFGLGASAIAGLKPLAASAQEPIQAIPVTVTPNGLQTVGPVSDYISGQITEKVIAAFEPLVGLVQALSYPIAFVMITGACLFIMIGHREKGLSMIQTAGIGYILIQLSPLFMSLLAEVGKMVA